jgi:glycosyltransferase involved in cell wall biosynthesis
LTNAARRPAVLGPHQWHLTLPQVPFRNLPGVATLNLSLARLLLGRAVAHLGFSRLLTWFHVPHAGFLAGRCRETASVYYAIDDYTALPGVEATSIRHLDDQLTRQASLVFAASPGLVQAKQKLRPDIIFSPHGVDAELFGLAADLSRPIPEPARRLPKPVIGFFGVLDDRVDAALLEYLARRRPHWSFLLLGRIATDLGALPALPNVLLPGAVPYETVPDWARAFDIALMPYRIGAFSHHANPLKLREYLATGRPVVSVPMPEVHRLGAGVAVAETPEQFLASLEHELAGDNPARRAERQALVADATWEARVIQILDRLEQHLAQRSP